MADVVANPFQRVERVHFVGIAGAGMSGIAEVMHNLGYRVSGSDLSESAVVSHLRELGIAVLMGHAAENIAAADVVVVSTAVSRDNPEVMAAREARVPVIPRAEMLAEIMRFRYGIAVAGTHGKTTTTSLVASLLAEGGLDPTYVIGGRLNSTGSNARLGEGRYFVAEADESDASFLGLNPIFAIVTNVDADHLETYGGDVSRLESAFVDFLQRLPFYGLAILCIDDPGVRRLLPRLSKPYLTYGTTEDADLRARNIRHEGPVTRFEVSAPGADQWLPMSINLPGRHNVLNALAAIAMARELHVDDMASARGLAAFQGIGRRLQITAPVRLGEHEMTLVDDYAHHPTELAATMGALRAAWPDRRLVLVFQPHRYTRTRDVFEDYVSVLCEADRLLLLEVYPAGEAPIAGADGPSLCRAIRLRGQVDPVFAHDIAEAIQVLPELVADGDVVLVTGAGSIAQFVPRLLAGTPAAPGVGEG